MGKIDNDKMWASIRREASFIASKLDLVGLIDVALREQGLEYKEGQIIDIEASRCDESIKKDNRFKPETVYPYKDEVQCVVEYTGKGYLVRQVYFDKKEANDMMVFLQGMKPSKIFGVGSFKIIDYPKLSQSEVTKKSDQEELTEFEKMLKDHMFYDVYYPPTDKEVKDFEKLIRKQIASEM